MKTCTEGRISGTACALEAEWYNAWEQPVEAGKLGQFMRVADLLCRGHAAIHLTRGQMEPMDGRRWDAIPDALVELARAQGSSPLPVAAKDAEMSRLARLHDSETRVTDKWSGGQKGAKLGRYDLIPVEPLLEVARLYGVGAEKYASRNWERGYDWSLSYAAMQRHANLFWAGESVDAETQRHHLAAVVFHAFALMQFEAEGAGNDDRAKL